MLGNRASEFAEGESRLTGRHEKDSSMNLKRIAKRIAAILFACMAPGLVAGCAVVTVAGAVVSVAATAVDVGVAVGSTAVNATTGVVKAVLPSS